MFLLALNPGFREDDYTDALDTDYYGQWRLALSFQTRTPFYFLDPAFAPTGGFAWWHRRLRELIEAAGITAVAQKIICVEHFPYKSIKYKPLGSPLPSQRYSFGLISRAIEQRKQIVIMRSERTWLDSVPELRGYAYIRLTNNQNPYLSRSQMSTDQFESVLAALA